MDQVSPLTLESLRRDCMFLLRQQHLVFSVKSSTNRQAATTLPSTTTDWASVTPRRITERNGRRSRTCLLAGPPTAIMHHPPRRCSTWVDTWWPLPEVRRNRRRV